MGSLPPPERTARKHVKEGERADVFLNFSHDAEMRRLAGGFDTSQIESFERNLQCYEGKDYPEQFKDPWKSAKLCQC